VGTEITLDVGGMMLDWSKNSRGADHGFLFQGSDCRRIRDEDFDYAGYTKKEDAERAKDEMGFVRKLDDLVPRLELLGYTLERVEKDYQRAATQCREDRRSEAEEGFRDNPNVMSFEEYRDFVTKPSILSLSDFFGSGSAARTRRFRRRFPEEVTSRIPTPSDRENYGYSLRSFFGSAIGVLHPYATLRLLAENRANRKANVVWQYGPLVGAGWAKVEEFVPGARRRQTFLIATEGSSDVHILEHAFELLKPGIADFFRFMDVREGGHPFSGTGNLLKFADGLRKIDVHNQIVFLFDNDAEGFDTFQRMARFELPPNMRAIMLPELKQFRSFPARGPDGVTKTDINRRAAAIECYLDLGYKRPRPAEVVWTNYKRELGFYQGALEGKEIYMKPFLKLTREKLQGSGYDTTKLESVLDLLVRECSALAAAALSDEG
jgi:hypothetical protein